MYFFSSNHSAALAMNDNDRRFYVLDNAETPETPEYFDKLNKWINGKDENGRCEWAKHIWRYLHDRKVDVPQLLAPPAMTESKAKMLEQTKAPLQQLVDAVIKNWPSHYLITKQVEDIVQHFSDRVPGFDSMKWEAVVKHRVREMMIGYGQKTTVRVGVKSARPRLLFTSRHFDGVVIPDANGKALSREDKLIVGGAIAQYHDIDTLREKVIADVGKALDLLDL